MVRKLESYLADKARILLDDSDLTSRSDLRRDRLKSEGHFMALAARLCETSEKRLSKLDLDSYLLELIGAARRIDSPPARDRAVRRIRKELRDIDTAALEARLDELDNPSPNSPKAPDVAWANRLLEGGEKELDGFLADYGAADRGQIRTLVRNALKSKPAERPRAIKKLTLVLREAMASPSASQDESPASENAAGANAAGENPQAEPLDADLDSTP